MFLGAMFPGGLVGAALLLGRLAAAALLAFALRGFVRDTPWALFPIIGLAICLAAGLLTRFAAAACAALVLVAAARADGAMSAVLALSALQVAALVLTGGGAYSLDARLFGRRVIRLDD